MSLILDALRKSEAERKRGEVPGLHSGRPARHRSSRHWLPAAAGALALVTAAGAGWWWLGRPHRSESVSDAAGLPEPAPQPLAVAGTAALVEKPSPQGSLDPSPLPERESQPVSAATADLLPTSMGSASGAVQGASMSAGGEWPTPELAPPATAGAQPMAAEPVAPAASMPPSPVAEPNPVPGEPIAAAPTPPPPPFGQRVSGLESTPSATLLPPSGEPPAPLPALPTIHELDYPVRRELPKMLINMHVWHADPERRFVLVNGKRHVVGGEAIDGKVLVLEIRPDGLVCEFNGQRFLLPR